MLLFKYLPGKAVNFIKKNPIAARYTVDGLFITSATTIAISSFNLFAVRLGANDYQLSLVQFLPQIFTMFLLIPGGLFMDSLRNKKRIVIVMLAVLMLMTLLCSISPFTGTFSIQFFLISITLSGITLALYNIAWQTFFPTIVDLKTRNYVLTFRTRVSLFAGLLVPLFIGVILTNIESLKGKIYAHQIFFIVAVLLLFLAALNFQKFRSKQAVAPVPRYVSFSEIKKAGKALMHNKQFLLFAFTAMFFHMTWHFDWTLYFIGQVTYLKMNEFQLGLVPLGAAAIQLFTLKFWSRKNEQYGVVLPFTFGILGLSLCPLFLMLAISMPISAGPHVFVILHMLAHIPFCVVTLNLFQCLLQVVDEEYRSFSMSVFASMICLSNAVMPVAGVALYHVLGADADGLRYALGIIFILRLIAAGLWLLRWRSFSKHKA